VPHGFVSEECCPRPCTSTTYKGEKGREEILPAEELHDVVPANRVAFGEGDEQGPVVFRQWALLLHHRNPRRCHRVQRRWHRRGGAAGCVHHQRGAAARSDHHQRGGAAGRVHHQRGGAARSGHHQLGGAVRRSHHLRRAAGRRGHHPQGGAVRRARHLWRAPGTRGHPQWGGAFFRRAHHQRGRAVIRGAGFRGSSGARTTSRAGGGTIGGVSKADDEGDCLVHVVDALQDLLAAFDEVAQIVDGLGEEGVGAGKAGDAGVAGVVPLPREAAEARHRLFDEPEDGGSRQRIGAAHEVVVAGRLEPEPKRDHPPHAGLFLGEVVHKAVEEVAFQLVEVQDQALLAHQAGHGDGTRRRAP
jgi:hypothetical protein